MINKKQKNYRLLVKPIILAIIVILIIGYSILKIKDFAIGPKVTLYSPTDGADAVSDLINIKGKAERISQIFINGRKIFTDETGNFDEPYLLASGYNLLEIMAKDQFGRQVSKKIQLTFDEKKTVKKSKTATTTPKKK